MEIKTKYITLDDFRIYFGIDLVTELEGEVEALAFLKRIEDRMESYLQANFYKKIDEEWFKFTDYQKKHYKLALLEQAIYIFRNGDISVDSGYDPDIGKKIDRVELVGISLAKNAREHLCICGLLNRCLDIKRRGGWFNI